MTAEQARQAMIEGHDVYGTDVLHLYDCLAQIHRATGRRLRCVDVEPQPSPAVEIALVRMGYRLILTPRDGVWATVIWQEQDGTPATPGRAYAPGIKGIPGDAPRRPRRPSSESKS